MWRRYSVAEGDILDLGEDAGTDVGAQGVARHELDAALEELVEEEGQSHEAVEALLPRREVHQEIDVASRPRLVPRERSEEAEPLNAESAQPLGALVQPRTDLGGVRDRRCRSMDYRFHGWDSIVP